MRWRRLRR